MKLIGDESSGGFMRGAIKILLAVGALGASGIAVAQLPALGMLARLDRGQWTVTPDDGSPPRRICLGSAVQLIQLGHGARVKCTRLVEEDEAGKVTVQYTCRGNGFGRTTVRRETDALVQIESQGIAGGRPFQFKAEARRTGACR